MASGDEALGGHEEILEWHAGFGMPMPGGMPLAHTNLERKALNQSGKGYGYFSHIYAYPR